MARKLRRKILTTRQSLLRDIFSGSHSTRSMTKPRSPVGRDRSASSRRETMSLRSSWRPRAAAASTSEASHQHARHGGQDGRCRPARTRRSGQTRSGSSTHPRRPPRGDRLTLGGPRCSAEALARVEPMYATASLVSAWLLIEQPGAWGPDALTESKLPTEIAAELERNADDVRILLIRNRSRIGDPIYYKGYSGKGRGTVTRIDADGRPVRPPRR